jgi:CDP-diacylglycerol--serine O-phosphatidyltransferase
MREKRRKSKERRTSRIRRDDLKKGIYILPNLITTLSLFSGFFSIISSIAGKYEQAAWAIFVATFFDGIDGKVARLTKTESEFGVQYDSLSDLVSFGVAPAILLFMWALAPFARLGWLGSALYVICAALRLARFNVQITTVEKSVFNGLPSPGAAVMLASFVLFFGEMEFSLEDWRLIILIMVYFMGFLMVSNVKYSSFKELDVAKRRPFHILFLLILIAILIATRPEIMIFTIISFYVLSGPLHTLYHSLARRKGTEEDIEEKKIEGID